MCGPYVSQAALDVVKLFRRKLLLVEEMDGLGTDGVDVGGETLDKADEVDQGGEDVARAVGLGIGNIRGAKVCDLCGIGKAFPLSTVNV